MSKARCERCEGFFHLSNKNDGELKECAHEDDFTEERGEKRSAVQRAQSGEAFFFFLFLFQDSLSAFEITTIWGE